MRTNYVLIDYENIQPEDIGSLDSEEFRAIIFVGAKQQKVGLEVARVLQKMGERAEYVQISGQGPNALDMHISYYIGRVSAVDASAFFHIVSKDTGFDPLIAHLKSKKVLAARVTAIADISILKPRQAKSHTEKVALALESLRKRGTARPRTVKTLTSTIIAIFQKNISEKEATSIFNGLVAKGAVTLDGAKVTYHLDAP